ncbi:hypothetical protein J4E81_004988 [Alternaria sp. BMP 2799]|uniref:uncharacterized protein n=1 Tax=Alternaria infectoria TaxID=45303 RepID=UPI00221EA1AF|nr:uncharacterized protein J4E92_006075 [Alternaria infectoria]KAI4699096.1 hypothetical protein J4E81_004988 [Alternaria sp. BMP 2799]KAI4926914.1 hypothetical protein J4E92_006075 [Alternaria infectoria]
MFSKTIILALFASSAAFAASIQQRQLNPSVQLCSNKDFNDCDNASGRLNDKVSSLKANGHNCIFYNDTGCRNGNGQIATTGDVANIRSHSEFSTMNDDISSFLCNV